MAGHGLRRRGREAAARRQLTIRRPPWTSPPRWKGAAPATLGRMLLHVVQECARHARHLDLVRELLDVTTGEDA
ncbi:MAG: DUF664 domain-containing protein [Lapillicoccus sp.]